LDRSWCVRCMVPVMSVCPYCLQQEKDFFSDKCNQCNTKVSFGNQVFASVLYTICNIGIVVLGIALFVVLFG
jgi:uncharacterized protein (DUF983 family)